MNLMMNLPATGEGHRCPGGQATIHSCSWRIVVVIYAGRQRRKWVVFGIVVVVMMRVVSVLIVDDIAITTAMLV